MSLRLLFWDELMGFYRSKVMLSLWIGMPLLAVIMHFYASGSKDIPLSLLTALVVSSLSGTLSSAMLVVSILSERERHVYDLYAIRPVRRSDIMLGKFFAVYFCVGSAAVLAIALGAAVDVIGGNVPMDRILPQVFDSLLMSLGMLAVTGSAGVLIGIASPSILVGVILVIYGGNQISGLIGLAGIYLDSTWLTLAIAVVISAILLLISFRIFERKQL